LGSWAATWVSSQVVTFPAAKPHVNFAAKIGDRGLGLYYFGVATNP
jgi:hypothetical protein